MPSGTAASVKLYATGLQRSRDTSILRMPRSARERDRVAHVGKPGDVGERALEAEAEAGVRYRAVATQVAVPAVVLPVDSELRHPCIEHVEPLLALAEACVMSP